MSHHQRAHSTGDSLKAPHTVSLKVLRLARPSLADQFPLPNETPQTTSIPIEASLADSSSADAENPFIITPLLSLPSAFGAAYVGETFACTLCANNEVPPDSTSLSVSPIRIAAEIQTPSHPGGIGLSLQGSGEEAGPDESVQRILKYELSEEGNHVLAVTVTYTETTTGGAVTGASGGRVRTFRKLYQFVAQQLLNVRTKTGDLPPLRVGEEGKEGKKEERERYALEAQLENLGHAPLSLETVTITTNPIFQSTSLNWPSPYASPSSSIIGTATPHAPILNPRDVVQVAFLLSQKPSSTIAKLPESAYNNIPKLAPADNRTVLGQLAITWRGALGERGSLRTAWLTNRR